MGNTAIPSDLGTTVTGAINSLALRGGSLTPTAVYFPNKTIPTTAQYITVGTYNKLKSNDFFICYVGTNEGVNGWIVNYPNIPDPASGVNTVSDRPCYTNLPVGGTFQVSYVARITKTTGTLDIASTSNKQIIVQIVMIWK